MEKAEFPEPQSEGAEKEPAPWQGLPNRNRNHGRRSSALTRGNLRDNIADTSVKGRQGQGGSIAIPPSRLLLAPPFARESGSATHKDGSLQCRVDQREGEGQCVSRQENNRENYIFKFSLYCIHLFLCLQQEKNPHQLSTHTDRTRQP